MSLSQRNLRDVLIEIKLEIHACTNPSGFFNSILINNHANNSTFNLILIKGEGYCKGVKIHIMAAWNLEKLLTGTD